MSSDDTPEKPITRRPNYSDDIIEFAETPTISPTESRRSSVSFIRVQEDSEQQPFYIEVPYLSREEKALYGPVPDVFVESEDELDYVDMRKIVGEYKEGGILYYYAKPSSGLIRRYPARKFKPKYPALVEVYEREKAKDRLLPFDPSGSDVEPASRVKIVLKLNRQKLSPDSADYVEESSQEEEDEEEEKDELESEADSNDNYGRRTRRKPKSSSSKKAPPARNLRTSRRKARSTSLSTHDYIEDSEEESGPSVRAVSRTSRAKKKAVQDDDDAYEDDTRIPSDSSWSEEESTGKKKKKSKVVRGAASIPAYGNIRVIADLELDIEEDDVFHVHRHHCEKCHTAPAHELLNKISSKGKRKRRNDDDEDVDPRDKYTSLGGWVRCIKCSVCAHWSCLASTQREEIHKAVLERDRALWRKTLPPPQDPTATNEGEGEPSEMVAQLKPHLPEPTKRDWLDAYQTTEFVCGSCMKGGYCMCCKEIAVEAGSVLRDAMALIKKQNEPKPSRTEGTDIPMDTSANEVADGAPDTRLFRCQKCKRLAHYEHLPQPPGGGLSNEELADYYQATWICADCVSFRDYQVDQIIAWRPFPEIAVEPPRPAGEEPNYKASLPREYLVKWALRSYRRVQWVPHGWLLATAPQKLRSFLKTGSRVKLLEQPALDAPSAEPARIEEPNDMLDLGGVEASTEVASEADNAPTDATPDAEVRLNPAWKTVDRILEAYLWSPEVYYANRAAAKGKSKKRNQKSKPIELDDDLQERIDQERDTAFEEGVMLSFDFLERIDDWERRTGEEATEDLLGSVVWAFIKWDDLGYDQATWDSPPTEEDRNFGAFQNAFKRFIASRSVNVKSLFKKSAKEEHEKLKLTHKIPRFTDEKQPQLGQDPKLSLMSFQVDGVNWLCSNFRKSQHCILADEMGLGKTVQVVTSLGVLMKEYQACPALVVVPNSTITNWVREFERWAPELRVCPFYGEAKARDIIKEFELYHYEKTPGTTGAKFHVLVTTYETVTNPKEFTAVFKSTPHWEVLVIDEGQRLKSDSSLIFRKLKELNTSLRVILTGTPLNNNIRELFNLMNFLDPAQWTDLENLAKEFKQETLTEDRVKELHVRLRPYFLRRIKAEVLKLPPKNEVIVPVSMSALQREIYRSILSQNLEILKNITQDAGAKTNSKVKKTNMNNMLMQLRKCLQHPYLVSRELEPTGLQDLEAHEKLIDASAKLRLLKVLLPKLKARGHRVLLFSQFSIGLDIIEDFLIGEGIKYLRLDGNTKQSDRQKGMDEFNKPDSDVFIYILTTRAGGVGINLWSADTVIIFDPDFNPHQDLQAIARAHRYGQQKTCLVFKLMVKHSAEEKMMQTGKEKLALDHLIVQKMDDEDSKEDVQSILMFGAGQLFQEDQNAKDIHYSEHDIEKLIEKTETEGDQQETRGEEGSTLFSFAKVWAADKDSLEEMDDNPPESTESDAWAQTLQKIAAERDAHQIQEETGRGTRRKAAAVFPVQTVDLGESPKKDKEKKKKKYKSKAQISDESDAYAPPPDQSEGEESSTSLSHLVLPPLEDNVLSVTKGAKGSHFPPVPRVGVQAHDNVNMHQQWPVPQVEPSQLTKQMSRPKTMTPPIQQVQPAEPEELCGLCQNSHAPGVCVATESAENLAQFRHILLTNADQEPLEDRRAAIAVIEETLQKQNKLHLIYGQPLYVVPPKPRKQFKPTRPKLHPSNNHPDLPRTPRPQERKSISASHSIHKHSNHVLDPQPSSSSTKPKQFPQPVPKPSPLNSTVRENDRPPKPSPLKRPHSPSLADSSKRVKEAHAKCPVCLHRLHVLSDCPVVKKGSKSTWEAVLRLEKDPTQQQTVHILRKIHRKQSRRELEAASQTTTVSK